jgi:hypothetical protein
VLIRPEEIVASGRCLMLTWPARAASLPLESGQYG